MWPWWGVGVEEKARAAYNRGVGYKGGKVLLLAAEKARGVAFVD
jgi:hypothetical protein